MKKLFFLLMIVTLAFTTLLCPGKQGGDDATQDGVEEGAEEGGAAETPNEGGQGNSAP